ncbi:hypothetical protein BGZ98_007640 [Dissophora globulifera]|nr:hypothetical protein BGZ98_007640 [Dissophora globulifera]
MIDAGITPIIIIAVVSLIVVISVSAFCYVKRQRSNARTNNSVPLPWRGVHRAKTSPPAGNFPHLGRSNPPASSDHPHHHDSYQDMYQISQQYIHRSQSNKNVHPVDMRRQSDLESQDDDQPEWRRSDSTLLQGTSALKHHSSSPPTTSRNYHELMPLRPLHHSPSTSSRYNYIHDGSAHITSTVLVSSSTVMSANDNANAFGSNKNNDGNHGFGTPEIISDEIEQQKHGMPSPLPRPLHVARPHIADATTTSVKRIVTAVTRVAAKTDPDADDRSSWSPSVAQNNLGSRGSLSRSPVISPPDTVSSPRMRLANPRQQAQYPSPRQAPISPRQPFQQPQQEQQPQQQQYRQQPMQLATSSPTSSPQESATTLMAQTIDHDSRFQYKEELFRRPPQAILPADYQPPQFTSKLPDVSADLTRRSSGAATSFTGSTRKAKLETSKNESTGLTTAMLVLAPYFPPPTEPAPVVPVLPSTLTDGLDSKMDRSFVLTPSKTSLTPSSPTVAPVTATPTQPGPPSSSPVLVAASLSLSAAPTTMIPNSPLAAFSSLSSSAALPPSSPPRNPRRIYAGGQILDSKIHVPMTLPSKAPTRSGSATSPSFSPAMVAPRLPSPVPSLRTATLANIPGSQARIASGGGYGGAEASPSAASISSISSATEADSLVEGYADSEERYRATSSVSSNVSYTSSSVRSSLSTVLSINPNTGVRTASMRVASLSRGERPQPPSRSASSGSAVSPTTVDMDLASPLTASVYSPTTPSSAKVPRGGEEGESSPFLADADAPEMPFDATANQVSQRYHDNFLMRKSGALGAIGKIAGAEMTTQELFASWLDNTVELPPSPMTVKLKEGSEEDRGAGEKEEEGRGSTQTTARSKRNPQAPGGEGAQLWKFSQRH